ncbi:class I SAM-dependent methyltransferase [Bradyrhizobium sp. AUGA SZCCT0182]|uniref:class I SAM-dependent methyltransferase n=1 Tax=Bradyrhizobium sp. AUGA SZCCT0182 TaxID=2807667 RepID=UPI001BAC642B|nr:class I SAM-dependent methyltransferase [Bradyrhizobium sp. AUGA SZCCT0182]MBR1236299.1 class I SAM-dependent methyltransferase [Bradyrhizobium sp. AUGA SZCCT0182]
MTTSSTEKAIKEAYEAGKIYKTSTICAHADRNSPEYAHRLLWEKIELVRKHARPGRLVDLCCATGVHLIELADLSEDAVGIDFSAPFIEKAKADAIAAGLRHLRFMEGDAKAIPLDGGTVSTLYSFSALYVIPDLNKVISEVARVLEPSGRCVLDLGNSRSLNTYCVSKYTELPPSFHLPLPTILKVLSDNGLSVVEHRAFQLLPLWADRPGWLWPLLHPKWKSLMGHRVRDRMIDEWISNLPGLKNYAFRHLIVAEKRS